MGSDAYRERFVEAMGGHTVTSTIQNYFASQCLTDDVMAYSLLQNAAERRALVTGSFHGDYRDGVVARLESRTGSAILYVKVVQKSDLEGEDLAAAMNDPKYGPIADILYLIDSQDKAPAAQGKEARK